MTEPVPDVRELLSQLLDELRRDRAEVLDSAAVAARYGLSDLRTARAIMRETGGSFVVARRRFVHRATLDAWERSLAGDKLLAPGELDAPRSTGRSTGRRRSALPSDFWRDGDC